MPEQIFNNNLSENQKLTSEFNQRIGETTFRNKKEIIEININNQQQINNEESIKQSEINILFQELDSIPVHCDISTAYSETIQALKNSDISINDIDEVLALYNINPFNHIQVLIENQTDDQLFQDRQLWSIFMFAVLYDQTDIVLHLLTSQQYTKMITPLSIIKPGSSQQELHIINKKENEKVLDTLSVKQSENSIQQVNQYAIQLSIINRNSKVLKQLLFQFKQSFSCEDMCEIAKTFLSNNIQKIQSKQISQRNKQEVWINGLQIFLQSQTLKLIFAHSRPEDKNKFISLSLLEPILNFIKNNQGSQDNILKNVVKELKAWPYVCFSVLKYPKFFHKYDLLDKSLSLVNDNDLIVFIQANQDNFIQFQQFIQQFESQKNQKHTRLRELQDNCNKILNNKELIEPNNPKLFIEFIMKQDTKGFIEYFEGMKAKFDGSSKNLYEGSIGGLTDGRKIEDIQLYRYVNYQIQNLQDQKMQIQYLPQDEAIQHLLYEIDYFQDITQCQRESYRSQPNTEERYIQMLNIVKQQVIRTQTWNPLIFAIFYGQTSIIQYIFKQVEIIDIQNEQNCHQHLFYLLSDPFKVDIQFQNADIENSQNYSLKNDNEQEFLQERTSLLPLILALMTYQSEIFLLIWNHSSLWNKHIYLVLLSNYVFETQNPSIIRAFLKSDKTKSIYNSISHAEKNKFIKFTIHSLEQIILDDQYSQRGPILQSEGNLSELEQNKTELESILNIEVLSQSPYIGINLTENLLPITQFSTLDDFIKIIDQYRESPESLDILQISLENLKGKSPGEEGYLDKWEMINNNQIWAKKIWILLQDLQHYETHIYEEFEFLRFMKEEILSQYLIKEKDE